MTNLSPKDKARELINEFIELNNRLRPSDPQYHTGKRCALICCNEIIEALELANAPEEVGFQHKGQTDYQMTGGVTYWQQVKTEIELL